jgi:type IV fimbrial biogenesis protein FimU
MEKRIQKSDGFTLIEAMIAICILGVIAGIAAPDLGRNIRKYRMSASVRDLQSAVQKARMDAIKRGTTVGISFDLATNQCTTFVDNGANQQVLDAGDTVLNTLSLPDGVDMYALDSGATVIGFSGRGMLSFPLVTERIELTNPDSLYRGISIRITGSSIIVRSGDDGATCI